MMSALCASVHELGFMAFGLHCPFAWIGWARVMIFCLVLCVVCWCCCCCVCEAAQNILCVDGGDGGRMHTKVGKPIRFITNANVNIAIIISLHAHAHTIRCMSAAVIVISIFNLGRIEPHSSLGIVSTYSCHPRRMRAPFAPKPM